MDPHLHELLQEGSAGDEVSAIIRLHEAGRHPEGVRVVAEIGRFVTVRLARGDIAAVRRDPQVASMKAPDPLIPERDSRGPLPGATLRASDARTQTPLGVTGKGVVVGVVDWGVDVACPAFRTATGRTRLAAMWDQRGRAAPPTNVYGYGKVHYAQEIDRALASGDPYGALGYHPGDFDTGGTGTHGTHVLDIAAGNGLHGGPPGMAPEATLAFVHLAGGPASGLANLGDSVNLVEAVHFLFETAGARPCSVNLSIGNHGGPHDGSTLVEQALDELLTLAPGRALCQSTGNYRERATHSAMHLLPGQQQTLTWQTDQADTTPNELEVWYPGTDRLGVIVTSPTGERSRKVALGERASLTIGGDEPCRIYHRASDPQNRDHLVNVFLDPEAPAGTWQVTLIAEDVTDGRVHAWIERDEACRSCQSRFGAGPLRHGTTGTIANGRRTIAVGAYDAHTPGRPLASFSSMGPTRDGRQKPDVVAPGVDVLAARSASRRGGEQARLVRKSGTSMAAPHVTGAVALLFEAAARPLPIADTRRLVLSMADSSGLLPQQRPAAGSGYLDVAAAVAAARALAAPHPTHEPGRSPRATPRREEQPMTAPIEDFTVLPYDTMLEEQQRDPDPPTAIDPYPPHVSPAAVFDAFAGGSVSPGSYGDLYEVVVPPGGDVGAVAPGDLLIVRGLGEGGLAEIAPVAGSYLPDTGYGGPGEDVYAHLRTTPAKPAVARLPLDRMIVRPRTPVEELAEAVSRAHFERKMAFEFAVRSIRTGTFADQSAQVNSRSGVTQAGRLTQANWRQWDPGPSSDVYEWILDAFIAFDNAFGGVPPVTQITFFQTHYDIQNGVAVADPRVGARYGGGSMEIFQAATTGGRPLPIARSNASGSYPNAPVLVVTGVPGQTPGAPLAYVANRTGFIRSITHELGHGLGEMAHRGCNDFWTKRYPIAAGWSQGHLFDVGIPSVRSALQAGQAPPTTVTVRSRGGTTAQSTEITPGDWNHPRWMEQPMTHYMVDGGLGEDFAEAVMAHIDDARLFAQRCPSRSAFFTSQSACWKPYLRKRPPVGDFPTPPPSRNWA